MHQSPQGNAWKAFFCLETQLIKYCLDLLVLSLGIQAEPRVLEKQVSLQAGIESQQFCAIDDDTSILLVGFKVRWFNNGTSPIVMNRPIYPLLLISRTRPALRKGDHEFASFFGWNLLRTGNEIQCKAVYRT